jgi:hypothetical protein
MKACLLVKNVMVNSNVLSRAYSSKVTNDFAMKHRAQLFDQEKYNQVMLT